MQDKFTKILKAISDPTRREIFHALILVTSALPINQIATNFNMTRQGVTKHLKVLENANLVSINSQGRERYCLANAKPLKEINKWLQFYEQFWDDSLNNLGDYLNNS
jgi:DNA-binding transcriptional ArsR family regulator